MSMSDGIPVIHDKGSPVALWPLWGARKADPVVLFGHGYWLSDKGKEIGLSALSPMVSLPEIRLCIIVIYLYEVWLITIGCISISRNNPRNRSLRSSIIRLCLHSHSKSVLLYGPEIADKNFKSISRNGQYFISTSYLPEKIKMIHYKVYLPVNVLKHQNAHKKRGAEAPP